MCESAGISLGDPIAPRYSFLPRPSGRIDDGLRIGFVSGVFDPRLLRGLFRKNE